MKSPRGLKLPAFVLVGVAVAASVLAIWLTCIGDASAHGGATGIIKQRMDAMEEIKHALKALQSTLPDAEEDETARQQAVQAAALIRDRAGKHMTHLFPPGSLEKPSEAVLAIWQEWPAFQASAEELHATANALAAVLSGTEAKADSVPPDLRGLSPAALFERTAATCKSCHDKFRQR